MFWIGWFNKDRIYLVTQFSNTLDFKIIFPHFPHHSIFFSFLLHFSALEILLIYVNLNKCAPSIFLLPSLFPIFSPSLSPALPFSVVSCVLAPTTFPLLILQRGNASLHMQLGSSQMHLPYRPLNIFLCCILIWLSEFFNNASYLFKKKKCTSNPCNLLRSVVVRTCLAYGSPS